MFDTRAHTHSRDGLDNDAGRPRFCGGHFWLLQAARRLRVLLQHPSSHEAHSAVTLYFYFFSSVRKTKAVYVHAAWPGKPEPICSLWSDTTAYNSYQSLTLRAA